MDMDIQPKKIDALFPTDIVFQTAYWGKVKSRLGWKPIAFDFRSSTGQQGDVMMLIRPLGRGLAAACIPQGPEFGPAPEKYGPFLEALSQEMVKHLAPSLSFATTSPGRRLTPIMRRTDNLGPGILRRNCGNCG